MGCYCEPQLHRASGPEGETKQSMVNEIAVPFGLAMTMEELLSRLNESTR
jgi:hypothetical protein